MALFAQICPAQPPYERQLGDNEAFDVLAVMQRIELGHQRGKKKLS